jgi:hypothetical protein
MVSSCKVLKNFVVFSAFSDIIRDILFTRELKLSIFFSLFGEKGPSALCFTEMRCRGIFVFRDYGTSNICFSGAVFSIAILFYM